MSTRAQTYAAQVCSRERLSEHLLRLVLAGDGLAGWTSTGIPDEWVSWFKQAVEPGRVIVALLVEDLAVDALVSEVERFPGAEFVYANLDPDTIDRVKAALGD